MQRTSAWKFAKLTGIFSKEINYKNYSLEELVQMKKIQIYPTKEFVILSDKLKKNIFDVSQKDYENREIIESHKPLILSTLNIYFFTEFKDKTYLNGYDEIIFDACISEQYKGNEFTTPAIIHRTIGGSKTKITITEQERILKSVKNWLPLLLILICRLLAKNSITMRENNLPIAVISFLRNLSLLPLVDKLIIPLFIFSAVRLY